MKTTTNILTLLAMSMLLACGQPPNQAEKTTAQSDSTPTSTAVKQLPKAEKQLSKAEWLKQRAEEDSIDSLRIDLALKDAFKTARKAFKMDNFTKRYELQPDDSSYIIHIEIVIGSLFEDSLKYFLLRRSGPGDTYLDLYKIVDNKAKKQIERKQGEMTYVRDTIFDANGDGHPDFLVQWHPSSGCCVADVYNVYLYQPDKGKFTKDYEFINPTFSATEKIIRGVGYGHPGEVGLYKYKWNGLHVDTIEFIYPDVLVKGQFIKTEKEEYRPTKKEGIVLKDVPREYKGIESYRWFAEF